MPANFDPFQRRCIDTTTPDPQNQSTKGGLLVLPHIHDTRQRPELQVRSLQSQALSCQLQFAIEEYYFFCGLMQFVLLFFQKSQSSHKLKII
jgi:hypothetical protein